MVKITGTDLSSVMSQNRTQRPVATPQSRIQRPVFGRGPVRGVPTPTLPPVGISALGTAIQPGHVIQNVHAGSPDVLPWTPLVSNLRHRVGPYEKLPPWKYQDEGKRPTYAKPAEDWLAPDIKIISTPATTSSGVGGISGGGGGTGGGGQGSGGGSGRLK